jgi:hypothetical protein
MNKILLPFAAFFLMIASAQAATPVCEEILWSGEGKSNCVFARDTIELLEILAAPEAAQAYARVQGEGLNPNNISVEIKDDANDDFGNSQVTELSFGHCHGPFGPRETSGASFKVTRRLDKRIMDAAKYRTQVSRIKRFRINCR